MQEQVFTVIMSTLGGLLLILGFFCTFILNQIFSSIKSQNEKLTVVLGRLEGLEAKYYSHSDLINMIIEQLRTKCDKSDCRILNK